METKVCSNCGKELPITSFYTWVRKDGSIGVLHQCLKCQRHKAYVRHYKKKNKSVLDKMSTGILIAELEKREIIKDGILLV